MFEVSHFWLIFLNISIILLIHLVISHLCNKIQLKKFNPENFLFRIRNFEKKHLFYLKILRIKSWKKIIPDGAKLFRAGFQKKELKEKNKDYLRTFMIETCRAELTHWLQILPFFIFFLYNVWWSGLIMFFYLIFANLPCILLQRHNRARLKKVIYDKI